MPGDEVCMLCTVSPAFVRRSIIILVINSSTHKRKMFLPGFDVSQRNAPCFVSFFVTGLDLNSLIVNYGQEFHTEMNIEKGKKCWRIVRLVVFCFWIEWLFIGRA